MIFEVCVNLPGEGLLGHGELAAGGQEVDLGRVLVEHHAVEVATLVVVDEIVRGVAGLHSTISDQ